MKRPLKPRPAVTAAPIVVSDLTCFDLVGLTAQQFRDLLRRHRDVRHVVLGQRLLVRADALLALLDRLASPTAGEIGVLEDDEAPSADQILALVGRRRA